MWFRLAGADWSGDGNSLGSMSSISGSWTVQCTTSGGISKTTGAGFVTQGGTWTGTFTLATGAEFTSATLTPSTAGTVTSTPSGSTITITIANVSANCVLSVVATGGSSGGSGGAATNYTFTLTPTPASATVTLTATGYSTVSGTGETSITVADGTTVNWSVEADDYTRREGSWTISGDNKTENITLTTSSGEGDVSTIRYKLAPKNMVTGQLVNKTTGASEASTSSRYNEYTVDATWVLYADGYNASKTAKSGGVTYFDAVDTYLGYDALGEDSYGVEFEGELLTVPAGTTTVKVLSSTGKINPALYRETVGAWTEVTKDTTVVGKVTNKETGELEDSSGGRYTSYTVEDSWILCADGYASEKSAPVSYFDANGNYLGYDSLGGIAGQVFEKVTLNVPSGTTTIRVQAAAATQSMALYRLV